MEISEKDFRLLVKGNEKSFEVIFCLYYKPLVSYSMRYGLEQMEAEDVVFEIFHHIWEIREKLKSASALHCLLYMSTRNRTLNVLRNIKNRQEIISNVLPKDEVDDSDYIMEEEMVRLLDKAICELPKQCEQVIIGILAGKSLQEIADSMQISLNTAKTYKLRAIQSLQQSLQPFVSVFLLFLLQVAEKESVEC